MRRNLKIAFVAAGTALALASSPALASTTFDAFTSFNGAQGAGNFTYGSVDDGVVAGTLFTANTNCFIDNSICLQAAPNHDVPGVTKSATTSLQYGSVNVPTDRLLLHPGSIAANGGVFITFTAPTTSVYKYDASFSVQDLRPSGVTVIFRQQSGSAPASFFGGATLGADNLTYSNSGFVTLNAGDVFSTVINRDGSYFNDSTGENFTLTAVPEPTTWAMLLLGFGMVGLGLRGRRKATVRVAGA